MRGEYTEQLINELKAIANLPYPVSSFFNEKLEEVIDNAVNDAECECMHEYCRNSGCHMNESEAV